MADPDPFAAVRARFRERMAADSDMLRTLPAERLADEDTVATVHKLAGLAGTLGYAEVSIVAKETEQEFLRADADPGSRAEARDELLGALGRALNGALDGN